jgi:hypothetical protein
MRTKPNAAQFYQVSKKVPSNSLTEIEIKIKSFKNRMPKPNANTTQ